VHFNVSMLLREPVGSRRAYLIDEMFAPVDGDALQVRLQGPIELLRTLHGILVRADIQSANNADCDRCLRPASYPAHLEIEEEFSPTVDPVTGAKLPPLEDPAAFTIDAHHVLDLTEGARQAWLLSVPMQVLCRQDCRGLCPECGADRNESPCRCTEGPRDIRWATLAALRLPNVDYHREN